jgi:hypothetical protein
MSIKSGQSIVVVFTTQNPITAAATNADSLPTGTLVLNGVDNGAVVVIANVDAGRYKASVTLPTLAVSDTVEIAVAATVNGAAGKAIVWRDTKDIVIDSNGAVPIAAGAISFAQYASDLMLMFGRRPVFSGATTPNITDAYVQSGWYPSGGATSEYYVSTTLVTPMYIWNDGTTYWNVTPTLGVLPANYWRATTLNGTYAGVGTTTGVPTIVVHGNATLTQFQPAQSWMSKITGANYLQTDLVDSPNATALTAIAAAVWSTVITGGVSAGTIVGLIYTKILAGIGTTLIRVLGAIAGKAADASALADITATTAGATYDNTTDSLQAQEDGGPGGANTVTITINDGVNPVEGATVTAWNSGIIADSKTTNASGVVGLTLNSATYEINKAKTGYSGSSDTLVVSGPGSHTYSLTLLTITPSTPPEVTGWMIVRDLAGQPEAGVVLTLEATKIAAGDTGSSLPSTSIDATSAATTGLVEFTGLLPGWTYRLTRDGRTKIGSFVADDATFEIASFIG